MSTQVQLLFINNYIEDTIELYPGGMQMPGRKFNSTVNLRASSCNES